MDNANAGTAGARDCRDQAQTVDCLVPRLPLGSVGYTVPDTVRLHETRLVIVRLSPTAPPTAEARRTLAALRGTGVTVGGQRVKFSRRMQATLVGPDFEIDPQASRIRDLGERQPAEWRWDIRSRHGGRLPLHVEVEALVTVDGKSRPTPYAVLDTSVIVTATWRDRGRDIVEWVEGHWLLLGLLGIVGVTLFGLKALAPPWERVS